MSLARAQASRRSRAAQAAPRARQGTARSPRPVSSLALRSGARTHPSLFVQAKLEVNQPGDRYERQADAVAGKVMRMALSPGEEPRDDLALAQNPRALQRAPASQNTPSVSASTASAIRNPGPGQPLSPGVRSRIEPHLGANLGNVRVHSGPAASQAAASLQARAFTHQNHIFLRSSAQSGNLGLMAHEAAHVVQQGAAPVQRAPADSQEPPDVQRSFVDDLVEGAGAVADTVSGALVDAAGAVVDMGADFFWSTLETIAPGLAPILRQIQQEGILGYLGGLLRGALGRVFDSLTGEPGAFDQLVGVFNQLAGQVGGILTALASGDCQPLLDAVGQLKAVLEQIGSDVWNGITDFFRPVGEFFSGLWQQFGAPVVDWLKATAGEVWQEIQDLGSEIWAWTQPFRDDLAAGWNWVKEQLFGSAEGGEADSAQSSGGLVGWITEKAGQAWQAIQTELEPAIAPIQGFADSVVAFLPMGKILSLRETVTGFLGDATSLTERLGQPQDVVENQDTLRDEILPGVLTTIVSVREGLVTAGGWLSSQIGLIAQTVTGMIDSLRSNSILGAVAGAIGWVQEAVGTIYAWQQTAVVALFTGIADGLGYLSQFIQPVFNTLQQVVTVLGDLVGQIGGFITGIWTRIHACIREPLMQFLTEQIFSRIPLFDQFMQVPDLFARVAQTALTVLRKVFVDGDLLGAMWTYFSALLELLGLPPDLILRIIAKAATAFSDIINDPIGFFLNLLKALKQGFVQFFDNIFKHLLSGVTNWLFGQLAEAGISPPADLSLGSIIQFILDVLGLTIDNLFERLGNKIGREKAERIRAAFALATGAIRWIYRLVTEGPGALWEELKGQLSNLVTLVLDSVVSWMSKVIIARATVYLLGLMDPTFIMSVVNSLIAIYNVIETFVRYMRQILETVESVLDGIGGIARGAIGQAAGFVEASLVRSLPIVIAFLASLLGLGGLGRRISEMVESVREYVNQAIDWLIDQGLALFNALLEGGKAVVGAVVGWWTGRHEFEDQDGQQHTLFYEQRGERYEPMIASNPQNAEAFLSNIQNNLTLPQNDPNRPEVLRLLAWAIGLAQNIHAADANDPQVQQWTDQLSTVIDAMYGMLVVPTNLQPPDGSQARPYEIYWLKIPSRSYPTIDLYLAPWAPSPTTISINARTQVTIYDNTVRDAGGRFIVDPFHQPPARQTRIEAHAAAQTALGGSPGTEEAARRASAQDALDFHTGPMGPVSGTDPAGRETTTVTLGVAPKYHVDMNTIVGPSLFSGQLRDTTVVSLFEQILLAAGLDLKNTPYSTDHVTDLFFGGVDSFDNLWPVGANPVPGIRLNRTFGKDVRILEKEGIPASQRETNTILITHGDFPRHRYFIIRGFMPP